MGQDDMIYIINPKDDRLLGKVSDREALKLWFKRQRDLGRNGFRPDQVLLKNATGLINSRLLTEMIKGHA